MSVPIVDLRQDKHYYYLRLGYAPHFYATLSEFETAFGPDERRYDPRLGMWRVPKTCAPALAQFFPNFDTLASGRVPPVRPLYAHVPWGKLTTAAMYAAIALVALFLWRTTQPTALARSFAARLPAPVSRLVLGSPTQLAQAGVLDSGAPSRSLIQINRPVSNATVVSSLLRTRAVRDEHRTAPAPARAPEQPAQAQASAPAAAVPELSAAPLPGLPAACRAQGTPLGMVYVSAPQANLRAAPGDEAKAVGTTRRGEALCVYKIEGEWQGGTMESQKTIVWLHQSLLSLSPR